MRKYLWLALFMVLTLGLAACGNDDDAASVDEADDGGDMVVASAEAYCAASAALDAAETEPSQEDLDALVAVAPEDIKADVELFAAAVASHDMEAEGVAEAEANLIAFEEANCGGDADGGAEVDTEEDGDA